MSKLEKIFLAIVVFALLFCLFGCALPGRNSEPLIETLIDVAETLSVATAASAPVNPYALPISVGLAGITAVLEALRRKERSARKYAEKKLNGNDKTK